MSKAFTKETETEEAEPDAPDPLPKGLKNYVTPNGLRLLRDELDCLRRVERPKVVEVVAWAAGNGDRPENGDYLYGKKRLREIDRRLRLCQTKFARRQNADGRDSQAISSHHSARAVARFCLKISRRLRWRS